MVLPSLHMAVQVFSPDPLLNISVLLQSKVPGETRFSPLPTDSFASSATYRAVVSPFPCTLSRDECIKLRPRKLISIPGFPIGPPCCLPRLLARPPPHCVFLQSLAYWRPTIPDASRKHCGKHIQKELFFFFSNVRVITNNGCFSVFLSSCCR